MKPRLLPLLLGCAVWPAAAQRAPLPPGAGKDATEAGCATCHSLAYIPMNSPFMTEPMWKAEVTKMRTAFGAPIDDAAADAITAYLAANFGVTSK